MAANLAALKAFLINRVGDWALTLGILLTIGLISDLSLASLFSVASYLNGDLVFIFTIFILIGATAKSAQLGLHTWLASANCRVEQFYFPPSRTLGVRELTVINGFSYVGSSPTTMALGSIRLPNKEGSNQIVNNSMLKRGNQDERWHCKRGNVEYAIDHLNQLNQQSKKPHQLR